MIYLTPPERDFLLKYGSIFWGVVAAVLLTAMALGYR